jgi:hypothetical protein
VSPSLKSAKLYNPGEKMETARFADGPQAQIAKANSGTKRQRSRGAMVVDAYLKNRILTQIASAISQLLEIS